MIEPQMIDNLVHLPTPDGNEFLLHGGEGKEQTEEALSFKIRTNPNREAILIVLVWAAFVGLAAGVVVAAIFSHLTYRPSPQPAPAPRSPPELTQLVAARPDPVRELMQQWAQTALTHPPPPVHVTQALQHHSHYSYHPNLIIPAQVVDTRQEMETRRLNRLQITR